MLTTLSCPIGGHSGAWRTSIAIPKDGRSSPDGTDSSLARVTYLVGGRVVNDWSRFAPGVCCHATFLTIQRGFRPLRRP